MECTTAQNMGSSHDLIPYASNDLEVTKSQTKDAYEKCIKNNVFLWSM